MDPLEPGPGPDGRPLRPRPAATLILIDQSQPEPRVLMGRRRAGQVFLPDKFVFPGGRLERADYKAPAASELCPAVSAKLLLRVDQRSRPSLARGLAIAALRETFEETGLIVAAIVPGEPKTVSFPELLAVGWRPDLSGLTYFARAITPPGRPRRYDTRFFCAPASSISYRTGHTDSELTDIRWFSLREARELDLPSITRRIVMDLEEAIGAGQVFDAKRPVPFYFQRSGVFQRALLSQPGASP